MAKINYTIEVGEPLHLALNRVDGDISIVTSASATMKKAGPNGTVPRSDEPVVAIFITTARDNGWDFIIENTLAIPPGIYAANAKLNLTSGGPLKTEHVIIEVKPSVS